MIETQIGYIVLVTKCADLGSTAEVKILGRSMLDWVGAVTQNRYTLVDYDERVPFTDLIRPHLNLAFKYTVVLFSDTPLITTRSISNAINELENEKRNVVAMPRGYVFDTRYISNAREIYTAPPEMTDEFIKVDSCTALAKASKALKNRVLAYHTARGVRIDDFDTTFIDIEVKIEAGAVINPMNVIKGKSIIKSGAVIAPNNYIDTSIIAHGARVDGSRVLYAYVGENTTVGPNAYIRKDTVIGANCRIGDFVEIKNSVIADGCKISHLTYVGDCQMGCDCNVGCGVVFVNYDGKDKHRAIIGDRVFIGSNSNIVAPVNVASNAFIAAGSTVTHDVPESALLVARAREVIKPQWSKNKYAKKFDGDDSLRKNQPSIKTTIESNATINNADNNTNDDDIKILPPDDNK